MNDRWRVGRLIRPLPFLSRVNTFLLTRHPAIWGASPHTGLPALLGVHAISAGAAFVYFKTPAHAGFFDVGVSLSIFLACVSLGTVTFARNWGALRIAEWACVSPAERLGVFVIRLALCSLSCSIPLTFAHAARLGTISISPHDLADDLEVLLRSQAYACPPGYCQDPDREYREYAVWRAALGERPLPPWPILQQAARQALDSAEAAQIQEDIRSAFRVQLNHRWVVVNETYSEADLEMLAGSRARALIESWRARTTSPTGKKVLLGVQFPVVPASVFWVMRAQTGRRQEEGAGVSAGDWNGLFFGKIAHLGAFALAAYIALLETLSPALVPWVVLTAGELLLWFMALGVLSSLLPLSGYWDHTAVIGTAMAGAYLAAYLTAFVVTYWVHSRPQREIAHLVLLMTAPASLGFLWVIQELGREPAADMYLKSTLAALALLLLVAPGLDRYHRRLRACPTDLPQWCQPMRYGRQ